MLRGLAFFMAPHTPIGAGMSWGDFDGDGYTTDFRILKSGKDLGGKAAVGFNKRLVSQDFDFSDLNAPNARNTIDLSNQALGHNTLTSADI